MSHTAAAKWLDEAGVERRRVGRPRTRGDVGQLTLRVSEVEYAGLAFRARQRQMSLRAVTAAVIAEALDAGKEPVEPSGPPERSISPLLPVEVLDRLHVEADRRGMSVTALALGLALTAVPAGISGSATTGRRKAIWRTQSDQKQ